MSSVSKVSESVLSFVQTCHLRSAVDDTRNSVSGLKSFMKEWASSVVKFTHEWDRTAAAQRAELEASLHREQECSKETQQALDTCRTEMKRKIQELTITISRVTGEMPVPHISPIVCSTVLYALLI